MPVCEPLPLCPTRDASPPLEVALGALNTLTVRVQVRAKRLSFNKKRVKALSFKKIAYICTLKGVPLGVIVPMRDLTDWKNNK